MVNVEPVVHRFKKGPTKGRFGGIRKSKTSSKHFGKTNLPVENARRLLHENIKQALLSEKKVDKTKTQHALDASILTVRKLQQKMLVLACVKDITKTGLKLTLPGGMTGYVPITKISDAYSSRLQEMIKTGATDCPSLNDLYSCGDLVYAKLLRKSETIYSLNPRELHTDFIVSQLVPGLVLAATIVSKEDHGYTMDVGIRNVRAFLSDENLGQNQDDVGRNLFCSIASVSQNGSEATIILKAFDPDAPRILNVEAAALETIVPGCRLMFTVGEPVEYGLKGMLFEDMVPAYVNETMLPKVTSSLEKYCKVPSKKIPATLLYMRPDTKQIFVSLRPYPNNRVEMNKTTERGTVIEKARVKAVDSRGVWFQFGNKQRALLSRKTLLKQPASSGIDENVMENFQIGTTRKVFLLHHNPLEDIYMVTLDRYHAEIRRADDVIMGKTYECQVHNIVNDGALVNVGLVKGAITKPYYDQQNPLKVGDTIKVRAVSHAYKKQYIEFTNIPVLLNEKASILYDWDQLDATKDDQSFLGLVFKITNHMVLVRFFNGMVGRLNKWQYDVAKVAEPRLNAIEKFTVTDFDKATNKIFLGIPNSAKKLQPSNLNATVTCVHATGVDVQAENGETGTIPSECFSEFGEHNSLYMKLLQEGQTLTVVKTNPGTYSVRSITYFKTHPMHIESVESGMLLKGSCITVNGTLYVTPLLSNFTERIEIETKGNCRKIEDGSIIMMRVLNVNKIIGNRYQLNVSILLHDVCEKGIFDVYNFMAEYLKDVNNLVERFKEAKHAFANYTIGQHVECVIESIVPESNKIAIVVHAIDKKSKYTAKGIATAVLPQQPASSYKVGQKVPGRVVWIDVERKLVHVCLDQPLFERIVPIGSDLYTNFPKEVQQCWVIFSNSYVQVCCLQSGSLNAPVIAPVRSHYNDMKGRANNITNTVTVRLLKKVGQMILAVTPKVLSAWDSMCWEACVKESKTLVRCIQKPEIFNASFKIEEDESEYDSDGDTEQSAKETVTVEEYGSEQNAHARYDSMEEDEDEDNVYDNDETDDESSPPTKTANGNSNGKQQKKVSTSKSSRNGNDKPKLKRKIVADAKESAQQKQLPSKKKKNKISSANTPKMAAVVKVPKKSSVEAKKSIILTGTKTKKSGMKKKLSALVIDQLDGANDLYLAQLDGVEDDHIVPTDSKLGSKKRKRTTGDKGLPGATNFWDSTPVYKRSVSDSSDNEADSSSDNEQCETVGKKRTTGKERFEAMKQEEERLRKIEDELANPSVDPHTPDQFDRLVLAQPNNSMLWIRYMAFHMESAELEKARAVGRKALKAIHFREETDRLNVWMALLNLEIRYETVDSFKEVLQEAVQYNDAFKVYSRAVDILIDCQKQVEVQQLLELLLKKFRKQNDMWFLVADAWYRIGQGAKVKPLLSQALKSLPTREHIPMIVKFAFLHNRNENRDEAHLLFEQILTSYPKRTDIWSQYIDMLVKDNLVGNARQILERAIMQRLPMKNMKTLYTKYVTFEEKHGDRESVRRVKQMAADYVQAQLNNAGIK